MQFFCRPSRHKIPPGALGGCQGDWKAAGVTVARSLVVSVECTGAAQRTPSRNLDFGIWCKVAKWNLASASSAQRRCGGYSRSGRQAFHVFAKSEDVARCSSFDFGDGRAV